MAVVKETNVAKYENMKVRRGLQTCYMHHRRVEDERTDLWESERSVSCIAKERRAAGDV